MALVIDEGIHDLAVKTVKMLAIDAVERARSGHPGMPMGAADLAYVLWTRFLRFAPSDPDWPDRDRFVLSAGHASMLLYSLLHLTGFDVSIEDIKQFRQWGSITPGHPEHGRTPGVECTTGPLGQGFAAAVGMALAGKRAAALLNDAAFSPISHRVFVLCSDGDLMEGVTAEAASLAGHLGLDNLVAIYDFNSITIEGPLALSQSEDTAKRFAACGWKVFKCDGHDREAIARTIRKAINAQGSPCLVIAGTHIGAGSPCKQDDETCHGAPLGSDEARATKRNLGWPEDAEFLVPEEARAPFLGAARRGERDLRRWRRNLAAWLSQNPEREAEWERCAAASVPEDIFDELLTACPDEATATRQHSGRALGRASELVPCLLGGSADLGPSVQSLIKGQEPLSRKWMLGRNVHFGVREHAMAAICNGLALSGSVIPYCATFLVFADYMRPAIRLAAMMGLRVIYLFSHDSLMVGEDGPTHQPVEQLASLRLIPNLAVMRPADAAETAAAWALALTRRDGPTALILSRQKLGKLQGRSMLDMEIFIRGGYVISEAEGDLRAVIIATGSEVSLALKAREAMGDAGRGLRIVSMPWLERFREQQIEYRDSVLPHGIPRAAIELGSTMPWGGLVGQGGLCIGHNQFGASAPAEVMADKFGFTPDGVARTIGKWLEDRGLDD